MMRIALTSLVVAFFLVGPASGDEAELLGYMADYRESPDPEGAPAVLERALAAGSFDRPSPLAFTAIEFFARILSGRPEEAFDGFDPEAPRSEARAQALAMILWRAGSESSRRRLESLRDASRGQVRAQIEQLLHQEAPDLLEVALDHPVKIRMLWGRFFATGEAACVERMVDVADKAEGMDPVAAEIFGSMGEHGGCAEVEAVLRRRLEGRDDRAFQLRMLLDRAVELRKVADADRSERLARRRIAALADPGTREEASRELAALGRDAFVPLVEAAAGGDAATARPAAEILAAWPLERCGRVRTVALSADGRRLACGSEGAISLWDVETGRLRSARPAGNVRRIALAGERIVAVARGDGDRAEDRAGTWDAADLARGPLREWPVGRGVMSLWLSPDGTRALTTGFAQVVQIWDPGTGGLVATCQKHGFRGTGAVLTPDGKKVVSTGDDNLLRRYDLAAGRELESVQTFEETMERPMITRSVAVSPDGSLALAGALDGTIRIWRLGSLEIVGDLTGHEERVYRMVFAGETELVTIAGDGTLRRWNVPERRLLETVPIEGGAADLAVAARRVVVATDGGAVVVRRLDGE